MPEVFNFIEGDKPLLISCPHAGSYIPEDIRVRLTDVGRASTDSDWRVDWLYNFAREEGYSLLIATHSRYVVDLNRPADGTSLYPGQNETGLCPTTSFSEQPLYADGGEPGATEIAARIEAYWKPYHEKLRSTLSLMHQKHGKAKLWEAHSIKSHVPRFFEGQLPDLNLGTNAGLSASEDTANKVFKVAQSDPRFSSILNGRFKGGYITRAYADLAHNIEAMQLEISQTIYMDEDPPFSFDTAKADMLRPLLQKMLKAFMGENA